jgi:sirohydrochlorin ferrochelatase
MTDSPPRLLLVAHGTRSAAGIATSTTIASAVAAARPGLDVDLCFLDVAEPTLVDALAADPRRPTVLVPLLLSTGYHVEHDIPEAVHGRPDVTVVRHLGPHPLLTDALVQRLTEAGGRPGVDTVLVAAGSTRPDAARELDEAAHLLATELGSDVLVRTMADDLASLAMARRAPMQVATYLLAEGQFTAEVQKAFAASVIAAPIGAHPALVELVLNRFDSGFDSAPDTGAGSLD